MFGSLIITDSSQTGSIYDMNARAASRNARGEGITASKLGHALSRSRRWRTLLRHSLSLLPLA